MKVPSQLFNDLLRMFGTDGKAKGVQLEGGEGELTIPGLIQPVGTFCRSLTIKNLFGGSTGIVIEQSTLDGEQKAQANGSNTSLGIITLDAGIWYIWATAHGLTIGAAHGGNKFADFFLQAPGGGALHYFCGLVGRQPANQQVGPNFAEFLINIAEAGWVIGYDLWDPVTAGATSYAFFSWQFCHLL